MDNQIELNKKDETELKRYDKQREEREQKRLNSNRRNKIKKVFITALVLLVIFFVGRWAYSSIKNYKPADDIISKKGIHWHSELSIYIKGVKQELPKDLGIGIVHESIHTHDSLGILHLESKGLVRKNDIKLGKFFQIWGKKFDPSCIFDYCNGLGGKVKFLVNQKENNEFQDYLMQDGDKMEIRYE